MYTFFFSPMQLCVVKSIIGEFPRATALGIVFEDDKPMSNPDYSTLVAYEAFTELVGGDNIASIRARLVADFVEWFERSGHTGPYREVWLGDPVKSE
ncbi:hypothetical protein NONI108955_36475 [Nocardia ninae]|uniref:Uncharacterized protein n=1 Tax=Nocardia ninae NBRC 108245 TaxID=1210091 RepID=A0A511MG15_9NOCA|nr:hypothetical protein [Nocardia ninae]GEM39499.1 hypothetical protein NN4_40180 [Nocardia ninae NBRC 108245]